MGSACLRQATSICELNTWPFRELNWRHDDTQTVVALKVDIHGIPKSFYSYTQKLTRGLVTFDTLVEQLAC